MENIKNMLRELCRMMSVSGSEYKSLDNLIGLYKSRFDECNRDSFGNCVFVKRALRKNASKLMIGAHFDEIGMMVSKIEDGGFLRVVNIGGLDGRILPSSEVIIYGKKEIYGVISSTPPHLQTEKSESAIPEIKDVTIDTGYEKSELEKFVSVGDFVRFRNEFTELESGFILSSSLDNKACVCAVLDAVCGADAKNLSYDVYVTLSAQEETGRSGARLSAFDIKPDIAIITDVNFATCENVGRAEAIECGKGAGIDISALTDRKLTKSIIKIADSCGAPYQIICEPSSTGTDNELVMISSCGVRTAVMSIPLLAMHTTGEAVSLNDIKSLSDILRAILYTPNL